MVVVLGTEKIACEISVHVVHNNWNMKNKKSKQAISTMKGRAGPASEQEASLYLLQSRRQACTCFRAGGKPVPASEQEASLYLHQSRRQVCIPTSEQEASLYTYIRAGGKSVPTSEQEASVYLHHLGCKVSVLELILEILQQVEGCGPQCGDKLLADYARPDKEKEQHP